MLIYDPRKGDKTAQRLSLQGNPSEKTDFFIEPKTNEVYDFIRFARTLPHGINTLESFDAPAHWGSLGCPVDSADYPKGRGRFSKHFDKDGNPSETLFKAKQERLENWRTLQELAAII